MLAIRKAETVLVPIFIQQFLCSFKIVHCLEGRESSLGSIHDWKLKFSVNTAPIFKSYMSNEGDNTRVRRMFIVSRSPETFHEASQFLDEQIAIYQCLF